MRIDTIQALRAAAALSVVTVHVLNDAIPLDPGGTIAAWHAALPWESGVDLFFVISGFIMVHASAGLFGRRGAAWVFLGRRLSRVVPLYWLLTAAFVLVAVVAGGAVNSVVTGPLQVAASLVFVPWARPDGMVQPVLTLGWTLNYEMLFYAVFALFIGLPRRAALVGVAATLLAMVALHPASIGQTQVPLQTQVQFWTDPIILEFTFGMAVAVVRRRGVTIPMPHRAVLAAAAVALLVVLHAVAPAWPAPLRAGAPMAVLLAAAALGPDPAWSARVWKPMIWLGDASYALYLVHPFPMRALSIVWRQVHLAGLPEAVGYCLACLASAVVAAGVCHRLLELPATWLLRHGARRREPERISAGAVSLNQPNRPRDGA